MRKVYKWEWLILMVMLIATSCCKEQILDINEASKTFVVGFADDEQTKVYIDNQFKTYWNSNDEVSVFTGSTLASVYKFSGSTGDKSGKLTYRYNNGDSGVEVPANYALYPYDKNTTLSELGHISYTFRKKQSNSDLNDNYGDHHTMVAVTANESDNYFLFKNVCGYLGLYLYGVNVKIKRIELRGNNNEKISGLATIIAKYGENPVVEMSNEATNSIMMEITDYKIDLLGATAQEASLFLFEVPPTEFTKGFTVEITDINGNVMTKSTEKSFKIERNLIKSMAPIEVVATPPQSFETNAGVIPNNEIWYKTNNGNSLAFQNEFKNTISEHFYDGEKWVVRCKQNILTIPLHSIETNNDLEISMIEFPSTVSSIYECNMIPRADNIFLNSSTPPDIYYDEDNEQVSLGSANIFVPVLAFETYYKQKGSRNFYHINFYKQVKVYVPNNQIIYTTIDGNKIKEIEYEGLNSRAFDATIMSHIYENGVGIVTFNKNLTSIGENAIYGAENLKSLYLPNSVTTMGGYAISMNANMFNVQLPSNLRNIKNLNGNESLEYIYIPESMQTIEEGAFMNCINLEYVTGKFALNNRVVINSTLICAPAAYNGNTHVGRYDGITKIGDCAFSYYNIVKNESSKSVYLDEGIVSIGNSAFSHAYIDKITFPSTLETIGSSCFNTVFMGGFKEFYFKSLEPPVLSLGSDMPIGIKIYVPEESVAKYKEAWSHVANYIYGYEF